MALRDLLGWQCLLIGWLGSFPQTNSIRNGPEAQVILRYSLGLRSICYPNPLHCTEKTASERAENSSRVTQQVVSKLQARSCFFLTPQFSPVT